MKPSEQIDMEPRWNLRPCPLAWCRSDNIFTNFSYHSNAYWRECKDCGIRGPERATWQKAVKAWDDIYNSFSPCPFCEARNIERMKNLVPTERDIERGREIERKHGLGHEAQ